MELTLRAVDSVSVGNEPPPNWTFGGGTALAIDLGHRVSYDIDAFLDSARVIQNLVPVRNEVTRAICWNSETERADYQYPGHYLKLIVKNYGEIDFLGASTLLDDATIPFEFEGKIITRERPREVIAKKIYYRGATFKSRDVFDLAGLYLRMPGELAAAASSPFLTPDIYARVKLRIDARKTALAVDMEDEVNPTEFGRSFLTNACQFALGALELMEQEYRLGL